MFSKTAYFTVLAASFVSFAARAGEFKTGVATNGYFIAPASEDGERAIKRFRLQKGMKAELFAAEPLLANPVAFTIDDHGRFYVAETFRLHDGVTDIRGHMTWLDEELASTTVGERVAYMKKHEGDRIANYTRFSDRVRLVWDGDGDGKADHSTVFADGFNQIEDGIGAGLLARRGTVYYANIPNLWMLRDLDKNGISDARRAMLSGFGVRVGFLGHDLHGLRIGPDGKLYFSIGDRGAHVVNKEGKLIANHEEGAVYRCDLDGSNLEIFAHGLRNPQELTFDEFGNLWTGENNSDGGDLARWVYVVEGGDSGWRVGFQFLNNPSRGVWLTERMCFPEWDGQAAFIVPPIANIGNGPSGLTYYPGTGLSPRYRNHFFLADFRGSTGSGVHSFTVKPRGASFEVADRHDFVWEVLVTDCDFGYDGSFYLSDWVEGWNKPGKGRIYRITDTEFVKDRAVKDTKELFTRGIHTMRLEHMTPLLSHPDMRVRQEAQFAIVENGPATAARTLSTVLETSTNRFARIHAVWGLGQIAARSTFAAETLNHALLDRDEEVRAQAAKSIAPSRRGDFSQLVRLLFDSSARVRFFAAQALGKSGDENALKPLIEMLRSNNDKDVYLRHAGVYAVSTIVRGTNTESPEVSARKTRVLEDAAADKSDAVRMSVLLAMRHLESAQVAQFLHDANPRLAAEAARAINDLPITNALPQLAALINDLDTLLALPAGDTEHPGPRDAVLGRVVNANFRIGDMSNAVALASFAANEKAPEKLRTQALEMLGEWSKPSGRDRITGLWRPLPERDIYMAGDALQPMIGALQTSSVNSVKLAATKIATKLNVKDAAFDPLDTVRDVNAASTLRVEALRGMAAQKDPRLAETLKLALADKDEQLRKAATTIQAQLDPGDALTQINAALNSGSISEKQNALVTLGTITNPAADALLESLMEKLLAKAIPTELQVELIEAAAKRTNAPVRDALQKFERSRPANDDLRAWRECLAGGDVEEGKKIFIERAEASCVRCHKFNGEGGEVGPDLTGIGSRKDREYILESLVYPNKHIAAGFENIIVTLKNGTSYAGLLKSETKDSLEINSPEDGVVRVRKSDIKDRARGLSGMPEELRQVLSKRDLRDLVEFLASSKEGAQPTPATTPAPATAPEKKPSPAE
jgi:quinoprotein glucose dehydrogenase